MLSNGIGNDTNYGHIKLSDDINSSSNINSGTGATQLTVKTAYDSTSNAQNTVNAPQSIGTRKCSITHAY